MITKHTRAVFILLGIAGLGAAPAYAADDPEYVFQKSRNQIKQIYLTGMQNCVSRYGQVPASLSQCRQMVEINRSQNEARLEQSMDDYRAKVRRGEASADARAARIKAAQDFLEQVSGAVNKKDDD
jgi:hypothetical protein